MRSVTGGLLGVLALTAFAPSGQAQVMFNREDMAIVHGWVKGPMPEKDLSGQKTYQNAAWRAKMLTQFPAADRNGDGTLTEAEAIGYHMGQARMFSLQGKELDLLPPGATHRTVRVPMRDGQTLPTELYFPAGEGPWPVVLVRTSRGRIDSALDYGNELLRRGFAFVGQDLTPEGDFIDADVLGRPTGTQTLSREDRASMNARRSRRNAGEDGYDAIEWIAKQSWCNGQIGMTGYSEASSQSKQAMALRPPHLTGVITCIGSISRFHETVRPGRAGFGGGTVTMPTSWTPPGAPSATAPARAAGPGALERAAPEIDTFLNDRTGWYDSANTQGAIDEWKALKHNGKSVLIMGIGDHGPLDSAGRNPPAYGDCDLMLREIDQFNWFKGEIPASTLQSRMYYFLMGDESDPSAPGNLWKVTDEWPVANTPTSWYLAADGTLTTVAPATDDAPRSYQDDPRNPIITRQGDGPPTNPNGPLNLSYLKDRKDILRFDSAPLAAPVEITGQCSVELYVSTDAPDTTFMVTVMDIYPDGYEWPIRDTGAMLRFRAGQSNPTPAKPGEVYKLTMPLVDTALVINQGHRIGLRVASSRFPRFEVHPNTWDAITSYDQAKVATNAVHIAREYPSRLVLPVVAAGASHDYVPTKATARRSAD